ncbi:MAG: crossover junction endodeoxyribonuclease RuvC [Ignavibacteriales bacterium CG_4_9_14_3_um_filter_30_11]|nr:MAG: crossover junction endodeoxyribonuclease RuvC [Ignavibacteriales bacterium CG_4_9_14_3_um_filter_30_11]
MIILGVDPGSNFTGYAVIKNDKNKFFRVTSGIIKLPSSKDMSQKLEIIYDKLKDVIKKHKPDEFVIETAFYGKNVQSTLKIGYVRGVCILSAAHNKIPVNEYSPREIKKAVVGNGAAAKEQVNYMVKNILSINEKMQYDESDALAIALCHIFKMRSPSKKGGNWKSFIEANPERVIS